MAETHELRLKIDAGAARRGSREFTGAVESVRRAVRDLERDTTGSFTKLKRNMDSLAKRGKIRIGVDRQAIKDLDSFARAQQKVMRSTTSSAKSVRSLITNTKGLAGAYSAARKASEGFNSSLLKTNKSLMRQVQLAAQAKNSLKQTRSGGTQASSGVDPRAASASAKAVRDLDREFAKLRKSAASASADMAKAFKAVEAGSRRAASEQKRSNNETARMENLQLSAASAIRRSEQEATRLSARLRQIGDTKGATAVNQSLIQLKANLSGGVRSSLQLRKAMDQFSGSTSTARTSLIRYNASQQASSAAARKLAQQNKATSNSARRVEQQMRSLAGANNAAQQSMRRATGGMRGMENAFNATFQAGSLFRAMLGSITFGTFISGVFRAGDALDQFRVTMEVASGSAAGAMQEMAYVDEVAARLGVNLQAARDTYSKFAISADIAGVSGQQTQQIFEGVSTAMAVLGKGTEDQTLAFMALEQMMSKGVVSSEELRRQLGERLPGAVNLMAKSLNVTTGELQDLLKAGAIKSADALPKFAEELMKRFGPGLEQATKRAGNNLQKLRNEVTLFGEEIAQSGFMGELAVQFKNLTNILASGEGTDAARKLGEALANGARLGGKALSFLVENLDEVGRVIKAIAIGVVVKQIFLFTSAVATASQQLTGYTAAWIANRNATVAAGAATGATTTKVAASTIAVKANSAATKVGAAAALLMGKNQKVAAASAAVARKSTMALTGSVNMFGKAAKGASAAALGLSRIMSVMAPIATVVVAGLMLIPGSMDAIGLGADKMSMKVNAALARSGVAFDEFKETIRTTAEEAEFSRIARDIETLSAASEGLKGYDEGWLLPTASKWMSIGVSIKKANGELSKYQEMVLKAGELVGSVELFDLSGTSAAGRGAAQDLLKSLAAVRQGQGSAVELQKQFYETINRYPSLEPLADEFKELIDYQLKLEAGLSKNSSKLTNLFGTDSEKLVKNFADQAVQVLKTSEGLDDLIESQKELAKSSPHVADRLEKIIKNLRSAAAEGASPLEFIQSIQSTYDKTAQKIIALRKEARETEKAVGEAAETLRSMSSVEAFEDAGLGRGQAEALSEIFRRFREFQEGSGLEVAEGQLKSLSATLAEAAPRAKEFKDAVVEQFAALDKSEQTYTRLDSILRETARRFPENASEIKSFSDSLRGLISKGDRGVVSFSDLENIVNNISGTANTAARDILGLADGMQRTGNASDTATASVRNAAGGFNSAGNEAAAATPKIDALAQAFRTLRAARGELETESGDILGDMQARAEIAGIEDATKRRTQTFLRLGEGAKVLSEIDSQIAEARNKLQENGAAASTPVGQDLMREMQELQAMRERFVRQSTETISLEEKNRQRVSDLKKKDKKGSSRKKELSEEQKAIEDLNKSLKDRAKSLREERLELELVASGQFETATGARMMAEAMVATGGAVDTQTEAMIRQIDAAAKLNEGLKKLAEDPVKEWRDSVPTWIEASKEIEMGAITALKDSISEFITTGKFDIQSLGDAILGTIADIVSDKAVKELHTLLNGDDRSGGGLLGGLFGGFESRGDSELPGQEKKSGGLLGGLFGGLFGGGGDEIGTSEGGSEGSILSGGGAGQGGAQAGQQISQAMIQAGQQVSQMLSTAMTQAGQQVGQQTRIAHTQGGQQAANAQRTAGVQHGQQVRTATMASGQQHATKVGTTIRAAGQGHAQAVGAAVSGGSGGGGGGGGIVGMISGLFGGGGGDDGGGGGGGLDFGSLASMAIGLFSEGGFSTNPASTGSMPISAFKNAPHYSQGTQNTSGIPAVLHDNEAVVPLSKGRKIPVEMGGNNASGGGGDTKVVNQTFNISTPDAGSFRKSQKQIAADGASSANRAMQSNS